LNKVIIETQYFPSIGFFLLWKSTDSFYVEQNENYNKRSLRNKCFINTSKGLLKLSVPLKKGKHQHQAITDVRITYDENWQKVHWNSIQSAYGRAPYFEHYSHELQEVLIKKYEFLFELNTALIQCLGKLLQWSSKIQFTDEYYVDGNTQFGIYRDILKSNGSLTVQEAKMQNCVKHYETYFNDLPNIRMSILDMLFYAGPETNLLLQKYIPANG
jgi:hypothetical protein